MKRLPVIVGLGVFSVGVSLELLLIALLPGSFAAWFALPDRPIEFAARICMQAVSGIVCGYLAHRAGQMLRSLKIKEQQAQEQERFLNHHVRNALSSLQYAAHLTKDVETIETCDSAVERIVWALSSVRQTPVKTPASSRRKRRAS
ncbi:MAG: hypothetical protein JWO13_926 [Acidobacteriales bacterium]|nr:hypothetical protein [Terriglobales bacterium]